MSRMIDLEAMKNVSTADLARRAHEEVYAICSGKRRWTMTVPVQDDDTDILIGFALEALEKDVLELRRLLWLRHHDTTAGLYGDDGEMQCAACGLDFKRDSVATIDERFVQQGFEKLRAGSTLGEGEK